MRVDTMSHLGSWMLRVSSQVGGSESGRELETRRSYQIHSKAFWKLGTYGGSSFASTAASRSALPFSGDGGAPSGAAAAGLGSGASGRGGA